MLNAPRLGLLLFVCITVAAIAGACGNGQSGSEFHPGGGDGSVDGSLLDGSLLQDGQNLLGDSTASDSPTGTLVISPANKTITVTYGTQTPTVTYSVTAGGTAVPASFAIDLGQIGLIDPSSGVLTPGGKIGGTANVTATYAGQKVATKVTVVVQLVDNGVPPGTDAGGGTGGNGGVGGSGPGGPVSPGTQTGLQGKPTADPGLAWLYPYDKTVWPQGLLAPLLQWVPGTGHTYDAIYIHLQENGFEYKGFFSAPATPFINHPILQLPWDTLAYSNQGEPVTVTLVFSVGGKPYGPLTETWTIAQGTLTGTVYYNSYGTALATNYCCRFGGSQPFGGATLAIKRGATSPVLVAGSSTANPSSDHTGCRVCHSVAAQGATLVTQHGDAYAASSSYALTAGNAETVMNPQDARFAFPAMSPDGTYLFSNAAPLPGVNSTSPSAVFDVPSGKAVATTGLPSGLRAGCPVFSPDGAHLAFNDYSGDQVSLASVDFKPSSGVFSNMQTLDKPAAGADLFPAFMPTNDSVIFEHETVNAGEFGATRNGARGELWWVDLKTHKAAPLAMLNGVGYLPVGANNHAQDQTLQYEPTVNPVPSGGYAWVVFTSRRMYGNVATIDPTTSDPRNYDGTTQVTPKKLWVAAIDLNAKPGSDPSHPAFYLPAQELLACNSRGYWVVDPCEKNGQSCLTGDQCCSGFCEDVDGGFVCGTQPPGCSAVGNKCTTTSDCCGSTSGVQCIDGFCSTPTPQ